MYYFIYVIFFWYTGKSKFVCDASIYEWWVIKKMLATYI